jgi:hypothetical protein
VLANRSRFPGEHEEGGLKDVLGILFPAQQPLAETQDERAMPADQAGEGVFVPSTREAFQKLAIALSIVGELANETDNRVQLAAWHAFPFDHFYIL